MAHPRGCRGTLTGRRGLALSVSVVVIGFAGWAVLSTSRSAMAVGQETLRALWLVPALTGLHFVQLLMSAKAWHWLLGSGALGVPALWRLRIMREGIDSLLPVAQVGGELVAAQILSRRGVTLAKATASVVVDVTLEFLSQLIFLLIGLGVLAALSPDGAWQGWVGAGVLTAAAVAALLLAQRIGLLRLLEGLARVIADRFPGLGSSSLDGLHAAAAGMYRQGRPLMGAGSLHLLAWLLGTAETWAVLHALGIPASPGMALVVESLGMAARSAGFAIPGALVVQETGFVLAAAAVGVPEAAGLSLSLVKRVREVVVGLVGLALWKRAAGTNPSSRAAL